MERFYCCLLILILPLISAAQEVENKELKLPTVNFHAGMIPLEYGQRPATDLVYRGVVLLPDEAHKLVVDSGGSFDLSLLEPDDTSVLWSKGPIKPLSEFSDEISVEDGDEVSFIDLVPSRSGNLRFTIEKEDGLEARKSYTVMLSKTTHNILLKRNLLRKLGYKVPKIKYIKNFKLKFNTSMEKAVFFSDFSDRTFGDPGRWVKNYDDHLTAVDRLTDESERDIYTSLSEIPKKQFKEVGTDRCLVSNPKSKKRMMLGDCSLARLSNFVIEDKGNSFFAIKNALNGKCLGIKNGSKIEGARFVEDVCEYKDNQLFSNVNGDGAFKLKVKQTGLCLSDKWKKEILSQASCEDERVISWYMAEGLSLDGTLFYEKDIELQDVIVMETGDQYYNLAMGFLTPDIIEGRRILNSLLVPYSLVDIPESANLFSWHAGRIINKQLKLEYETAESFNPSFEDAKWITRKILALDRSDWEEVVSKAYFPDEVGALITEKLISRRNHLRKVLGLEGEDLSFDHHISMGERLEKGELKGEYWDGHASRYSYGDPENPLSKTEIGHFIGSQMISSVISGVTDYVGSQWLNNSSFLNIAYQNHIQGLQLEAFIKFLETGVVQNIPVGVFVYPTFSGNLILSRDMVIGSYLGTDNRVQLADTFGFYVNAGVAASVYGIATGVPVSVSGRGSVTYSRTYSHLKPVVSFQASFKYPFRNVLVPWFKQKQGKLFDELLAGNFDSLPDEKKQEKIDGIIKIFKKNFGVGESLLISDNVIVGANLSTGVGVGTVVKLSGQIGGQNLTLSRLHILRKDENTLHVYKDLGNVTSLIMGLQADAVVPILRISFKASKGKATTNFYSLNLESDIKKNSKIKDNINALRNLFRKNSIALIKKLEKPYTIVHRFRETLSKASLAMLRAAKSRGDTEIDVTNPKGDSRQFFQSMQSVRMGMDIMEFGFDVANGFLNEYTEWDVNISNITSGAPGDGPGGMQVLYSSSLEGELIGLKKTGIFKKEGELEDPFVQITHNYRGFSLPVKLAEKIVEKFNEKYNRELFPPLVLNQTKKIFLYDIGVNLYIYPKAIEYLMTLDEEFFKNLVLESIPTRVKKPKAWRMLSHFKLAKKHQEKGNYKKYAAYVRSTLSMANRWLTLDGFTKLLGGDNHYLIMGNIDGYRISDEGGDTRISSNTIGQVGAAQFSGPIQELLKQIGMTSSEFYAYWIRGRLY